MGVLISGAGIAGSVLAWWLHHYGLDVTVVERTAQPRVGDGGHPVDLFGPAVEVVERMGLGAQVRAARTENDGLAMIAPNGRRFTSRTADIAAGISDRHIEIARGDLAQLVYEANRGTVRHVLGATVQRLDDTGDAVRAHLSDGSTHDATLVVGADGLHSGVRALVFGAESRLTHFLGAYLGVYSVPEPLTPDGTVTSWAEVGRVVAVYPTRTPGRNRALFMLRADRPLAYEHRDEAAQRALLRAAFQDAGWEVPRILAHLDDATDFYFDPVSQVRLDSWSRGRVTLVGDAGYGPGAAVGGGTSLAAVGAYVLAAELAAAGGDSARALPAYERAMAGPVVHSRRIGPSVLATLVPRTRAQAWLSPRIFGALTSLPTPVKRALTRFGGGPAAMLEQVVLRDPAEVMTPAQGGPRTA